MTPPKPRRPGHDHEWYVNDERRRSLADIGERLAQIGGRLKDSGSVKLDGVEIRPSAEPWCVIRYERMPHGELKLKIDIEWVDGDSGEPDDGESADLVID